MLYRTKVAMKILMRLTKGEALELSRIVDSVQERFYIGTRMIPFDTLSKEDAVANMKEMLKDEELDIPVHLRGHLERFLELMITERAPMDKLISEYNSAFTPVMYYELFKPDVPEDPIKEPDAPLPGTVSDGGDAEPDKEDAVREVAYELSVKDTEELEKELERLSKEDFEKNMQEWIQKDHRTSFVTDTALDKGQAEGSGQDGELVSALQGIKDILERMEGTSPDTVLGPGTVVDLTSTCAPGITKEDAKICCRLSQEEFDKMMQYCEKRKSRKIHVDGRGDMPEMVISIPCPPKGGRDDSSQSHMQDIDIVVIYRAAH